MIRILALSTNWILGLGRRPPPVPRELTPPLYTAEIHALKERFERVHSYLLALTLVSLGFLTALVSVVRSDWISLVACVAAGTMGSAVAALLSSQERRANGFELASGKKVPEPIPEDKFSEGMVRQFYARPLLGSVVGAAFYLAIPGVFEGPLNLEGRAFWSFVVGIMAKSFIGTLKDLFKKLGK